jgi:L-iditol 2-dehydrogenase
MVPKKMKAAVMQAKEKIVLDILDVPGPAEDEVLINVKANGVCGSDVHLFCHGESGSFKVQPPYIL